MLIASVFVASLGLTLVAMKLLGRWGVLDRPNDRSSHTVPTVRGGGAGFVLATGLGWAYLAAVWSAPAVWGALVPALVVAAVSMSDDFRPLRSSVRLAVQAACGLAALAFVRPWPAFAHWPSTAIPWLHPLLCWTLALIWIVGYTNAFNFMDGINGISSGQAISTGFGLPLLLGHWVGLADGLPAVLSMVLAAAVAGFLPYNFPRARIFMGDVGSATLGFLLALLPLWAGREHGFAVLLGLGLLHTNYVLDTGFTLVRRFARGERLDQPHREHFYQRLIRSGFSHAAVTGIEFAGQAATVLLLLPWGHARWGLRAAILLAVLAFWGGVYVCVELVFRSRSCASRDGCLRERR